MSKVKPPESAGMVDIVFNLRHEVIRRAINIDPATACPLCKCELFELNSRSCQRLRWYITYEM